MKAGIKFAVLGLLLERPSYGYEVLVRFRRAFGAAQWAISPQGLYAALDRLERDGLIEPIAAAAGDASRRQPKTPYRVTASGERELRSFLAVPIGADPSRVELLVRLHCVGAHDATGLAQMLDRYERACLDELGRIDDEAPGGIPAAAGSLVERLAREERRLGIQARMTWIDYARRELRAAGRARRGDAPAKAAAR